MSSEGSIYRATLVTSWGHQLRAERAEVTPSYSGGLGSSNIDDILTADLSTVENN